MKKSAESTNYTCLNTDESGIFLLIIRFWGVVMKRSHRLVALTNYFLTRPHELVQLSYFADKYTSSKSSISEDLTIIDHMFRQEGVGFLKRTSGATGGIRYIPLGAQDEIEKFIHEICELLKDPERILPGGYLYMSDLLGNPRIMRKIGHVFATAFAHLDIDVIMTVATKGISLAHAVAYHLNKPVVTVRRDPKVTEGSSVSINYVSGSSRKIQTMVLPKRSLAEGSNVCIVDDFMEAGGTINGMISLLAEFNAEVKAIGVLAEADDEEDERVIEDYLSLVKITTVDVKDHYTKTIPGNLLQYLATKS